jgi:hypothetical protein
VSDAKAPLASRRIAVDGTCWHNRRGYGRHAPAPLRVLVRLDSGSRYALFVDSTAPTEPLTEQCETVLLRSSAPTVEPPACARMPVARRDLKKADDEIVGFDVQPGSVDVQKRCFNDDNVHVALPAEKAI